MWFGFHLRTVWGVTFTLCNFDGRLVMSVAAILAAYDWVGRIPFAHHVIRYRHPQHTQHAKHDLVLYSMDPAPINAYSVRKNILIVTLTNLDRTLLQ